MDNSTSSLVSFLNTSASIMAGDNEQLLTSSSTPTGSSSTPSSSIDTKTYINFVYQDVEVQPVAQVILVIFFILSMAWGNIGNLAVMGAILVHRKLRQNVANTFIFNLAIADLCVTSLVDASYVIGNLKAGVFISHPSFCSLAASICIISCTCSMWSITTISLNRYIFITKNQVYQVIFTRRNSLLMAAGIWILCFVIDFPNFVGLGEHIFDHKKLGCSFDRLGHYGYTVYFIGLGVATPLCIVLFSYASVFLFVREHTRKIQAWNDQSGSNQTKKKIGDLKLLKTVFIIFVVFLSCWTPYTVIVLGDIKDKYPYEIYVAAIVLAHANSSMNSILYGITNKQFREGYKLLLRKISCGRIYRDGIDINTTINDKSIVVQRQDADDASDDDGDATVDSPPPITEGNSTILTPVVT